MFQLDDVSKGYGGDLLLDGVSLTLGKGERLSLIGRNGSGKTTLFRLLCGLEEADSGSLRFPKQYSLGYLNQHIHFSEPTVLQEAFKGLQAEEQLLTYKAESMLFGLGFQKNDMTRAPSEFSGGYQLRLHLAKLLLWEPDCLLLDEPTNYLDILSIRWLTSFLRSWPKEALLISHDRQFLDTVSTHSVGLHRKKLKKVEGPSDKLFEQIALDEEVHEKTRLNVEKKREHLQGFVDRFGAKSSKAAQAQSKAKAIKRLPTLAALCQLAELDFSFPELATNSKILLKAENIGFGYTQDGPPLIQNLSFDVTRNARLGIIGQNGKGKSTLLKLMLGELTPLSGTLTAQNSLSIGYFGQSHILRLDLAMTVQEAIQQANPTLSSQQVRSICGKMMFTQDRSEKKIGVLSGGERSRVVLGQLLATPSHLLLLDEPTNHLDVESMEAFMDALDDFSGAVAIVTHSELLLERLADELIVFKEGSQTHFLGTYEEFLLKGGWGDEVKSETRKTSSFKDTKRLRAELIQERAKLLKPHQIRMKQVEARIIECERELADHNEKLLQASQEQNVNQICLSSKAISQATQEIDKLFTELELCHNQVETIKAEFQTKLDDLDNER